MSSQILNSLPEQLNLLPLIVGFVLTFLATWILCKMSHVFQLGHDSAKGVQKFHVRPTSRLGGVAIAIGLVSSGLLTFDSPQNALYSEFRNYSFWFLLAALPVWLAGLTEDLTHKVGPTIRLVMATLSAAWLFSSLGVTVNKTDVYPIDWLLSIPGGQLCVTLLVVAGFTHSVNIVDGFHGLACGLMVITLSALSFMAWRVGDVLLAQMCLTSLCVVLGFFVFNWPKGSIFLGDAGAYLIGFWVVELGILIAIRNPGISPMAPVVAGLLPLIETLFSMYRRKFVRDHPVNHPDALHLHTLIYRRLLCSPRVKNNLTEKNKLNSRVALFFWLPALLFSVVACLFMNSTSIQLVLMLAYLVMYIWLYKRLIQFRSPAFLKLKNLQN
jgi:UDP-N-acetylmuramyl pentapeptide phosphotransferase/UDP-N-acetylglucosamine-1-phosphate transferase